MCRATTAAIQTAMVCAHPARVLERFPQGAAGAVEPDRRIVGRNPKVASHTLKRLLVELNPANHLCWKTTK
jgi:hypothetical protein